MKETLLLPDWKNFEIWNHWDSKEWDEEVRCDSQNVIQIRNFQIRISTSDKNDYLSLVVDGLSVCTYDTWYHWSTFCEIPRKQSVCYVFCVQDSRQTSSILYHSLSFFCVRLVYIILLLLFFIWLRRITIFVSTFTYNKWKIVVVSTFSSFFYKAEIP